MTQEGIIPRKRRKTFERFLHHADPRIRALAEQMQTEDHQTRKLFRADMELDEIAPALIAPRTDLDQDLG